MARKVYTLVKYEVKDGCDALNVLMTTVLPQLRDSEGYAG